MVWFFLFTGRVNSKRSALIRKCWPTLESNTNSLCWCVWMCLWRCRRMVNVRIAIVIVNRKWVYNGECSVSDQRHAAFQYKQCRLAKKKKTNKRTLRRGYWTLVFVFLTYYEPTASHNVSIYRIRICWIKRAKCDSLSIQNFRCEIEDCFNWLLMNSNG